jgi:hypothetical protein
MDTLLKVGKATFLLATVALITTGCESGTVQGYFANVPQSDGSSATSTTGTDTPTNPTATSTPIGIGSGYPSGDPTPIQSAVPNGPNDGVGISAGGGGAGNVIVYGDEWVARLGNDETNAGSSWETVVQPNLTNFWNDALGALTANSSKKRVLLARFNDAATTWDVVAASTWSTYLPELDSKYVLTDYDESTDGPLTQSLLSNYDALILVSYDPSLTSTLLTQYVQSGGSVMAMAIGFGVPVAPYLPTSVQAPTANYECLNLNIILANFAYKYDCGNPNSNFVAAGTFANINTSSSALPFNNGYAVIPVDQAETPY